MNKIVKEYFLKLQMNLPRTSKVVEINTKVLSEFLNIELVELCEIISNMFYNSIPFKKEIIQIETNLIKELKI